MSFCTREKKSSCGSIDGGDLSSAIKNIMWQMIAVFHAMVTRPTNPGRLEGRQEERERERDREWRWNLTQASCGVEAKQNASTASGPWDGQTPPPPPPQDASSKCTHIIYGFEKLRKSCFFDAVYFAVPAWEAWCQRSSRWAFRLGLLIQIHCEGRGDLAVTLLAVGHCDSGDRSLQ